RFSRDWSSDVCSSDLPWSQINQGHAARLIAEGRMRPAALAEIERARADGRWDAAYRQKDSPVPAELRAALDASPAASAFFATLQIGRAARRDGWESAG